MRAGKRDPGNCSKAGVPIGVEWSTKKTRAAHLELTAARRVALAAITAGVALVLIAQRLAPIAGPPLYDGVIVTDPYRWLSPPPGGPAGAQGATGTESVQGESPVVAIATPEEPPQAQIFAAPGSLVLPPNTSSLRLSIEPIQPGTAPTDGVIDGNEYEIDVLNQAGLPVAGRVGGQVTVVMRGPPNVPTATMERFSDGSWQPLPTDPAGLPDTYIAVVTAFGLFALVAPAPAATPLVSPTPAPSNSSTEPATTAALNSAGDKAGGAGQSSNSGTSYPGYLPALLGAICSIVIGAVFVFEVRRYHSNR
jgi:hypothetical protein